jgi:DNA-binding transcriptional ArsR family regulator
VEKLMDYNKLQTFTVVAELGSVTAAARKLRRSQSAVSQHLALLREEGVVHIRGEAQTRWYSLADPVVRGVIHALCELCGEHGI